MASEPQNATLSPTQIVSTLLGAGWRFVRGFTGGTAVNSAGHHGWDFSAALGTPIPAFVGGKVVYAENAGGGGGIYVHPKEGATNALRASQFWATGGGNVVVIEGPDGKRYSYAHLQSIAVQEGQTVTAGTNIGKVGDTGDATGPHLHFSLISAPVNGARQWMDPAPFFASLAAKGSTYSLLGAWNNAVAFPTGHILTEDDVNTIIAQLDASHFFQANDVIPGFAQLAENQARDKTRAILMAHVGEAWDKSLQDKLQGNLFQAASAVVDNPLNKIADIGAALLNPMTYVHTGALLLGLYLAFKGLQWTVAGSQRESA